MAPLTPLALLAPLAPLALLVPLTPPAPLTPLTPLVPLTPVAPFFAGADAVDPCTDVAADVAVATLDVLGPALSRSAVAGTWPTASATAPPRCWLFLDISSPDLVNLHAGGHEVPENTDRQ